MVGDEGQLSMRHPYFASTHNPHAVAEGFSGFRRWGSGFRVLGLGLKRRRSGLGMWYGVAAYC